jgi:hypothetical protein
MEIDLPGLLWILVVLVGIAVGRYCDQVWKLRLAIAATTGS